MVWIEKEYRNLKNGKTYILLCEVTNATNAQDGEVMCLYTNEENKLFVREKEEFHKKFIWKGEINKYD